MSSAPVRQYRLVARNTATTSENKIHDDVVARRYGFAGGLVPGVDVYAYMTRAPADTWGIDWLERGSMQARLLAPVYEGDEVVVVPTAVASSPTGLHMALELRNQADAVCATGDAELPTDAATTPPAETWREVEPTRDPAEASPDSLAPGTALALPAHRFHVDRASDYLAAIDEDLPLYKENGVAHPGWLLRDANYVLSANVRLGPWIHVESVTRHHSTVSDGEIVDARASVTREWERKRHRFVELDVGLFAAGTRLVARITHTAIYRPRPGQIQQAGGD